MHPAATFIGIPALALFFACASDPAVHDDMTDEVMDEVMDEMMDGITDEITAPDLFIDGISRNHDPFDGGLPPVMTP